MQPVDLNRLRTIVLENQRQGEDQPPQTDRKVMVTREGRIALGGDRRDEAGQPLSEVHQGTFAGRRHRRKVRQATGRNPGARGRKARRAQARAEMAARQKAAPLTCNPAPLPSPTGQASPSLEFEILPSVVDRLAKELASHAPERGGALLGPRGQSVVTEFLFDDAAEANAVTWKPSRRLNERVRDREAAEGLVLKGLVHSHPSWIDHPSGQDGWEAEVGLSLNPHMPCYLLPIVTKGGRPMKGTHEVPCGPGKLSVYAAVRTPHGARVVPVRTTFAILRGDVDALSASLGGSRPEVCPTVLDDRKLEAARVTLPGDLELMFLAGRDYPATAPTVLATGPDRQTRQVHLAWDLGVPAAGRLAAALAPHVQGTGPYQLAFGPDGGPAFTRDPARASLAGWTLRWTSEDPAANVAERVQALFARSTGILSRALDGVRVLVAGAGSVGSFAAEALVRSGVGRLVLADPEPVEAANLCRAQYAQADVGRPKVEALAARLLAIHPGLEIRCEARKVDDLTAAELDETIRSCDLVLACTDDPAAQRQLNHFAYARGVPALFVGLYRGAQGGEVVASLPGRTPCYRCATSVRHRLESDTGAVSRQTDYGTGRLTGEVALGADIHHVTTAAVKIALSLLVPEGSSPLADFARTPLSQGMSYVTFGMQPDWWFYPNLLGQVPGQYAYQSVWLSPERDPDCPVCGETAGRVDPLHATHKAPGRARLFGRIRTGTEG